MPRKEVAALPRMHMGNQIHGPSRGMGRYFVRGMAGQRRARVVSANRPQALRTNSSVAPCLERRNQVDSWSAFSCTWDRAKLVTFQLL